MSRKKELIIAVCILFFCFFSLLAVAGILISKPSFQNKLLEKISKKVGYNIRAKYIKISLRHGIGIKIEQLYVQSKQQEFSFSCPRIFVNYKISKLIKRKLIPETVILEKPSILINKENLSSSGKKGLPKEKLLLLLACLPTVYVKDAAISIKPFPVSVKKTYLYIKRVSEKNISLELKSKVILKDNPFPVNIKGNIYTDKNKDIQAKFEAGMNNFPLSCIKEKDIIIFSNGSAFSKFSINVLSSERIEASGNIRIDKPEFLLIGTDEQKKKYSFPYLNLQFKSRYKEKELLFQPMLISGEGLRLEINSKLTLAKSSPLISLKMSSSRMNMDIFKKVFPSCLLPDWLEKRLFPIIKKGDLKEIRFSLNGTPDQLKHLDDPANRSVLSGSLLMDRLYMLPRGAKFPLKDINGKLILKEGNLLIKDINAKLSSSEIKDARLLIKDLYYDSSRSYHLFLKGRFNLTDLMAQLHMEFTPDALLKAVKDLKEVSGKMDTTVVCEYKESWEMPVFKNSSALFVNTRIVSNKIPEALFIKKGNFWIDTASNYHFKGDITLGDSTLHVLTHIDQNFQNIDVNVFGDLRLQKLLKKYLGNNIAVKGPLKIEAGIKNKKDIWYIKGKIASKKKIPLRFYSFCLNPAPFYTKFSVEYRPKRISIKEFLFRSKRSYLYASAEISNRKKLKIKIKTKRLYLEDLGISYADILSSIKGLVNTNLKAEYTFSDPFQTSLYGIFGAEQVFVQKDGPFIKDCNMKLIFYDRKVSISSLNAKIEKYPLHLNGWIKGWKGLKGRLYARLDYLDLIKLKDLKPKKKNNSDEFLKGSELDLHVEILKAACKNIIFKPIKGEFSLKDGNILIKKLLANMDHGKLSMTKNSDKKKPGYKMHLILKSMPLEHMFSCLEVKKYIDGKINAEANIFTESDQLEQFISHMNGKFKISITDGKIYKAQPVLKILDFFSLANIWKFDPSSVFEDGVPFKLIKIKASIKNGVISSDKMILESKALNAAGKGNLDLNKKWIDLGIAIQPLGTIDTIISKLPVVGYIITGKDKKITLYYFEVKGALSNVKVEQKPIQNLVKGSLNIFKRILLTPAHIFEDIGGN